jgi:hypothetical protein
MRDDSICNGSSAFAILTFDRVTAIRLVNPAVEGAHRTLVARLHDALENVITILLRPDEQQHISTVHGV